jgi:hypothetical protein
MADWILEDRRVAYDGTDQARAHAVATAASCPSCRATLPVGTAQPTPLPGMQVDHERRTVPCPECGGLWVVITAYWEWQPARWVALEALVEPAPDHHGQGC